MPRQRNKENKGLPTRWRLVHGAYYYQFPPGRESSWGGKKLFRLGKSLPEAYKIWAAKIEANENITTIAQLLDRYLLEVVPQKAIKTQTTNKLYIPRLRGVFGDMPLSAIRPTHIYQYVDKRSQKKNHRIGSVDRGKGYCTS